MNAAADGGFGDNAATPHRGNQVILADDTFPVGNKILKKIENLWLDLDGLARAAQLPARGIQRIALKFIEH